MISIILKLENELRNWKREKFFVFSKLIISILQIQFLTFFNVLVQVWVLLRRQLWVPPYKVCEVNLPVHFLINHDVVLYWHGGVTDHLLAETIDSHNMSHSKHNKLLILIYMQLVTQVFCIVGYGVQIPGTLKYKNYIIIKTQ